MWARVKVGATVGATVAIAGVGIISFPTKTATSARIITTNTKKTKDTLFILFSFVSVKTETLVFILKSLYIIT
jgi:hypothetical protein